MKYHLVLQLPATSEEAFERLVSIEGELSGLFGKTHDVDGHDYGSGEMNIFIHTNDPVTAFEYSKQVLASDELGSVKAAYRELDGNEYTVIWPEDFSQEFVIT